MAFARYVQQMVETLGAEGTLSFVQAQIASMALPALKAEPVVPRVVVAVPLPAEPEPAPTATAHESEPEAELEVQDVPKKEDKRKGNGSKSNFLNDDFQKMCEQGIIPMNTMLYYKPGKRNEKIFFEGLVGTKYLPGGKKEYFINSGSVNSTSPSGFASSVRKFYNPNVSPAVDGWAFVKIKEEKGRPLKEARELWKAGKIEEAKALFV